MNRCDDDAACGRMSVCGECVAAEEPCCAKEWNFVTMKMTAMLALLTKAAAHLLFQREAGPRSKLEDDEHGGRRVKHSALNSGSLLHVEVGVGSDETANLRRLEYVSA
jgi:hypothetical protein